MVNYDLGTSTSGGGAVRQWEEDGVYVSKGSMATLSWKTIWVTIWPNYKGWKNVIGMIDGKEIDCIKRFILFNLPFKKFEELIEDAKIEGFIKGSKDKLLKIKDALEI